jgi:type VI secretion system secreted protein VgrG
VRAEELLAYQKVFEGSGVVPHLRPGYLFELEDHPRGSINGEYLCIALEHRGNARATTNELRELVGLPRVQPGPEPGAVQSNEVYRAQATAIPASVQFRSKRRAPKPRIHGTETALVDGPAESEYAQVDAAGRYTIKFAFDESALKSGKASTAVRMMQPHGGNPEGFHLPLRKGTEVMVAFVAGDPDRPLIVGAAPNALTPSPVTSSNSTRNIFHTGSDNHLEIEDEEGKQWFDLKTPPKDTYLHLGEPHDHSHYIVAHTGGDCLFEIGSNQDITVGGNLTEKVKGAVKEEYKTSQTSGVKGPQTTTVKGAVEEDYSGGQMTTTTGLVMELYKVGQKSTVTGGGRTERYETAQTTYVTGGVTQAYLSGQDLTQTGPSDQKYLGTYLSMASGQVTLAYDGAVTQEFGDTTAIYASANWTIPGAANVITSKWDLTMTKASFITSTLTKLKLNKTEAVTLGIGLFGTKAEAIGLSMGTAVLKAEVNGPSLALFGLALGLFSIKLDTSGDDTSTAALHGK